MKRFICGICKNKGKIFISTRSGLRNHLKDEHFIMKELANSCAYDPQSGIREKRSNKGKNRQRFWITEEI